MRKAFFYEFLPSKAEELAAIARGKCYEVTRTLIEIRDGGCSPASRLPQQQQQLLDPKNPWQIRKLVTASEVLNGKLQLSQVEILDHIFRYWTLDLCNHIIKGNQFPVVILDYTDEENPRKYQSDNIYIQGNCDTYALGFADVVGNRRIQPGDEVGLFWDVNSATLKFKLLSRGNSPKI